MYEWARSRNEQGSMILTVLVIIVATGLVFTTVSFVESGLRTSRRSGDSATALQLADAAINDAVAKAPTFATAAPVPPVSRTLGNGQFTYTATYDSTLPGFRVDAVGTDAAGLKRHVRAAAVQQTPTANALFVRANVDFSAGALVDSFIDGASAERMCTGKGIVGTNDAASVTYGSSGIGGGVTNCRDGSHPYPYDGCVSFAEVNPPDFPVASRCPPPPFTSKQTPAFVADTVYPPPLSIPEVSQNVAVSSGGLGGECAPGRPLVGGRTYHWASVTLRDGCVIQPTAGNYSVQIFTSGNVVLGTSPGNAGKVNRPPSVCPTGPAGADGYYCSGWPGKLKINVISDSSPVPTITMNNQLQFWGVINAPTAVLTAGNGPQVEMWGSMIVDRADTDAQFGLHYDESLGLGATGTFRMADWVEVPS